MLTIAQLAHTFFKPTLTWLHNTVTAFKRVQPVCVGSCTANAVQFPFDGPIILLRSRGAVVRLWTRGMQRIRGVEYVLDFNTCNVRRSLRRYDVRVLHAHFGYNGCRTLRLKQNTGLPMVTTFYGEDVSALPKREPWKSRYPRLFEEGEIFLVEGSCMRDRLANIGCPREKIEIQRIGIYPERYPFRERRPRPAAEPLRLLFCGSFREKKGLLDALEAVRIVHDRGKAVNFDVIGDGPLRDEVESFIRLHDMGSYVRLLGFQDHTAMIHAMNASDLFISPSVTAADGDSEGGAPTTILEAQACGLPVLATTHADIPNVVSPGSAELVPERAPEILADRLKTLLRQPEKWAGMGREERRWIENRHDVRKLAAELEDRYFQLTGQ